LGLATYSPGPRDLDLLRHPNHDPPPSHHHPPRSGLVQLLLFDTICRHLAEGIEQLTTAKMRRRAGLMLGLGSNPSGLMAKRQPFLPKTRCTTPHLMGSRAARRVLGSSRSLGQSLNWFLNRIQSASPSTSLIQLVVQPSRLF